MRQNGPGRIRNPILISHRPEHVENREEPGRWEGDLIIDNHSTALATLVERKTRYTVLVPLPSSRTMSALNDELTKAFERLPDNLCRSLTWDQGSEIAGDQDLKETTGLDVYLCNPNSPWQRGTNENTNGLLRQWFPRSTDFYELDRAQISAVAVSLNNRPRKTLNWKTPAQQLRVAMTNRRTKPGPAGQDESSG